MTYWGLCYCHWSALLEKRKQKWKFSVHALTTSFQLKHLHLSLRKQKPVDYTRERVVTSIVFANASSRLSFYMSYAFVLGFFFCRIMWPTYPLTSYFCVFHPSHAFIWLKMATMHNMRMTAKIILQKNCFCLRSRKQWQNRKQKTKCSFVYKRKLIAMHILFEPWQ